MRLKKAAIKALLWEGLGIVSFTIWTGDLTFSLLWALYRTVTFPIFEYLFKAGVRRFYNSQWPQRGLAVKLQIEGDIVEKIDGVTANLNRIGGKMDRRTPTNTARERFCGRVDPPHKPSVVPPAPPPKAKSIYELCIICRLRGDACKCKI